MIILIILLLVLLAWFIIWVTPAIIMGLAVLWAILTGAARGTAEGVRVARDENAGRPVNPRIEAMRASSARMKEERLAKRAARKAERENRNG